MYFLLGLPGNVFLLLLSICHSQFFSFFTSTQYGKAFLCTNLVSYWIWPFSLVLIDFQLSLLDFLGSNHIVCKLGHFEIFLSNICI